MSRDRATQPGGLIEPVIIEESFPDPLVLYMAQQIRKMPGPRETCVVDWFDAQVGAEERTTVNVPTAGLDERSQNPSSQELAAFKTGRLSPGLIRRVKAGEHEPIPSGILVRAMYLALEQFCATPTGRIAPTNNTGLSQDFDELPRNQTRALRVHVRRDLEKDGPRKIRIGEITVRGIDGREQ